MRAIFSSLIVVLATTTGRCDDTHDIRIKLKIDPGRTVTYKETVKESGSLKSFDVDGKLVFERQREGSETAHRLTVLETDKDGKVTKYVRTYNAATEKENGKTKTFSYHGRTLLFEKVDGKFRVGVVGEPPLDPDDVALLYKKANKKSQSD